MVQPSYQCIACMWKTIALTRWTFVSKVMPLLFNMLSRFVTAFLPRNKCLNFKAVVTVHSDFGAKETKVCHFFHCFAIYLPWNDGTRKFLLLGRKAMTNLGSILKSRGITLLTKVCLVKAMVFPVVMYECESWTIKKAERWRIDPFELRCWRRLLRVPWTARRSNQS